MYTLFSAKWVRLTKDSMDAGELGLDLGENRDVLRDLLPAAEFLPFF